MGPDHSPFDHSRDMDLIINIDVPDLTAAEPFCLVQFLGRGYDEIATS